MDWHKVTSEPLKSGMRVLAYSPLYKGDMMEKAPCENCLIYPICKNALMFFAEENCKCKVHTSFLIYEAYVIKIEPKCDLISSWLEINGYALKYDTIAQCLASIFNIKNYKKGNIQYECNPM